MPKKSVVSLTDRPDMTLDVYRGHKPTTQQQHLSYKMHAQDEIRIMELFIKQKLLFH